MNPQDWYNSRAGQRLLVPGQPGNLAGQCVQACDIALNEIYGLPYHYGNASEWYTNPGELLNNFEQIDVRSEYPKAGDFVVFASSLPGSGGFGHIDLCLQDGNPGGYVGADSNWGGNLTLHQVQHNYQYCLGYLRIKGEDMSSIGDTEARILIKHIYGYTNEVDIEGAIPGLLGGETNTIIRRMDASPTAAAYQAQIKAWANQTPASFKLVGTINGANVYEQS